MHATGGSSAYFRRIDTNRFMPSEHVSGAWNVAEQHVAPALGLMAHVIEADHHGRRTDRLQIGRLSYDILGTIPMEAVSIDVAVIRPGRTIELVEARLNHGGRPAVILRAWLAKGYDSHALAATNLHPIDPVDAMPSCDPTLLWPGGFIRSVEVRRKEERPGRASAWVRSSCQLVEGESVSPTARLMMLADIANGISPLTSPATTAFPNLDLTAHLFREPVGEWLGLDVSVSFGRSGGGLTHSIIHDSAGPLGSLSQWLTVRTAAL